MNRSDKVIARSPLSRTAAVWGKLLSQQPLELGARGAIIYGSTRDVRQIVDMGFKVFAANVTLRT